jgi:hypothetical protein
VAAPTALARSRERDAKKPPPNPDEPPTFDPDDELLAIYVANNQAAARILLNASFRWWEIRARKKALAR